MKVKFKKLHPNAEIPFKGTSHSVGYDVKCVDMKTTGKYIEYFTGLSFEFPTTHAMFLLPRSSISNTPLVLANSIGLGDPDFRGNYSFRFKRIQPGSEIYEVGDKIGQLVFIKKEDVEFIECEELSVTERNTGGYGHSGK